MIDARKTGAMISQLRKDRDWTQARLADLVGVTPQAVSRWETGETFPDIGILAHIAQVFDVRMDDLVYAGSIPPTVSGQVLNGLALGSGDRVAREVQDHPQDLDALVEAGPIILPSLMKEVITNMEGFAFQLEQVVGLAPFLPVETLAGLVGQVGEENIDPGTLVKLAPFLERGMLTRLVSRLETMPGEQGGGIRIETMVGLAPFLERGDLDRLVGSLTGAGADGGLEAHHIVALAPFLRRERLAAFLERLGEGALEFSQVISLAPFIEQHRLDMLVEAKASKGTGAVNVANLAPFVSRKELRQMMSRLPPGALDPSLVVKLAPFLDRDLLDNLVREMAALGAGTPCSGGIRCKSGIESPV